MERSMNKSFDEQINGYFSAASFLYSSFASREYKF
jgi:hypothetical protein